MFSACDPGRRWAERVAAAIRAALELARDDPAAARVLTVGAAGRRAEPDPEFGALVEWLAALWTAAAPAVPRPERTARNSVLRIARQVLLHIETRPGDPVTEIGPDLAVFLLTPYVGLEEARRCGLAAG